MPDIIKKFFIFALLALVAISYHIRFSPIDAIQTTLAPQILVLTVVTFIVCFSKTIFQIQYIKFLVVVFFLVIVFAFFCEAIYGDNRYFSEFKDLAVPLVALFIGYNAQFSRKELLYLVILYGIIMIFYSSMSQIAGNIGGFIIEDTYKIPSKNAIGAMLASLIAVLFPLILSKENNVFSKIVLVVLALLSVVVVLTIRARASTMAVLFTFVLFIFFVLKNRKKGHQKEVMVIITMLIIAIISIPLMSEIYKPIGEYIYNSLFQNVEGDITTGRTRRNLLAIEFFLEHPFWGRYGTGVQLPWVHNYVLRILTDYGLVFGFPLIILYLFFVIKVVILFFKQDILDYRQAGYWAVIPLIMLSFVEPLFPFSPGTAVLFSYLLLGYSLRQKTQIV